MSVHWLCAQMGAREHYLIPRALHALQQPVTLVTDFMAGPLLRSASRVFSNTALTSAASRWHPALRAIPVKSFNEAALGWQLAVQRAAQAGGARLYDAYARTDSLFSARLAQFIEESDQCFHEFVSYTSGSLEALQVCRRKNIRSTLVQFDPARFEYDLVLQEQRKWPSWVSTPLHVPEHTFERIVQEWTLADLIIVHSPFSAHAIATQGVAPSKIKVVPLGFDAPRLGKAPAKARNPNEPLRILFLGQVNLRKGIPYLIEAARTLQGASVEFHIVGPLHVNERAIANAPSNVFFHGRIDRLHVEEWYRKCHIFVLPTISDGFAITQLEAMSYGLPVIATPNCGQVVRDGLDGFVVPAMDALALATAIEAYLDHPAILNDQSQCALMRALDFSVSRFGAALIEALQDRQRYIAP